MFFKKTTARDKFARGAAEIKYLQRRADRARERAREKARIQAENDKQMAAQAVIDGGLRREYKLARTMRAAQLHPERMVFCPKCGTQTHADSFCPSCGAMPGEGRKRKRKSKRKGVGRGQTRRGVTRRGQTRRGVMRRGVAHRGRNTRRKHYKDTIVIGGTRKNRS